MTFRVLLKRGGFTPLEVASPRSFRLAPKARARLLTGFTLIEIVVAMSVFFIVGVSLYGLFQRLIAYNTQARARVIATALANRMVEVARNLPYSSVGLVSGIPNGVLQPTQTIVESGIPFIVQYTIRNIDDPFDGTLGGTPNDLAPADYKFVEVSVTCSGCASPFTPVVVDTTVSPKSLEGSSSNGALFVHVFDAAGVGVSQASLHIQNSSSTIIIDDTTDTNGDYELVDVPPGINAYSISATRMGYSSDQTYPPGATENPNPTSPDATVLAQNITSKSFAIDRTSTLAVATVNNVCNPVPSIGYLLNGSKLIGTSPDVLKYSVNHTTDGAGNETISNLEWDGYTPIIMGGAYDLAGSIPTFPLNIIPNSSQQLQLVLAAHSARSLLVTVKDAATLLPLTGVTVHLYDGGAYSQALLTGQGFSVQTDWSGGSGQVMYTDPRQYLTDNGGVDTILVPGDVLLAPAGGGNYVRSGTLTSSTFDFGTGINYSTLSWDPGSQATSTGADSVQFQIATSNDSATTTWTYLGPDGTSASYYTVSGTPINAVHNLERYLRYRLYLQTANPVATPDISDVKITFSTGCTPPGQVFFPGLDLGSYNLDVSKSGYSTSSNVLDISGVMTNEVLLAP